MIILIIFLFSSTTNGVQFDPELAQEIFEYARPAGCNPTRLQAWDCPPCQKHPQMQEIQVFFNNSHDAQGYCGYDAQFDRVVVAIRGTVDYKNALADMDYPKTPYDNKNCPGCQVHQGFYNIYQDLANNLLACVYTLHSNHPTSKVVVTGHSLGASQSVLAALEIHRSITKVDYFYNSGTPRVGNKAFANHVDSALGHLFLGRLVHWKDPFKHLPTQSTGFEHYGHEIFYNQDFSEYQLCTQDDKKCSDQFYWPWQWVLDDHMYYFNQYVGCNDKERNSVEINI